MPTLFLMCGLPGAGKTTRATKLEKDRAALRLSPDEWMWALSIDLYDETQRASIEALQWNVAARALTLGLDVILEFGFWSRRDRDDYRSRAAALGAQVQLCFLDVPRDELWARLKKRNAALPPASALIDEASLERWWSLFEAPTREELE